MTLPLGALNETELVKPATAGTVIVPAPWKMLPPVLVTDNEPGFVAFAVIVTAPRLAEPPSWYVMLALVEATPRPEVIVTRPTE